jgi:sporulation protein YlmC with PRC-barrel domain
MAEAPTSPEQTQSWVGHQLDDRSGEALGKVEGVLIDAIDGSVEWLLLRPGRFGQRALVPARDAVAAVDRVWVPFDAERVRAAPKAPGGDLTQADELAQLAHYGLAGPAGRAGELAHRDPGAVTAKPV